MEGKSAKKFSKGMVGCATASLYERDFTKRLEKMSALSALPPPLTTIRNETFFRVDGGWRCWQAAREYNGVRFGRMPARQTLYHTLVMVCGRASQRGASQNGGEFLATSGELQDPSARYSGQPPPVSKGGGEFLATSGELHCVPQPATLDKTPNLGCTLSKGCGSKWGWSAEAEPLIKF